MGFGRKYDWGYEVKTQYTKNRTKTPDSNGVFHLTQELEGFFKGVLEKKKKNTEFYGNTYSHNSELFVWEDGHTIAPDYVCHHFKKLVREFGRPDMTFHALRHSTASLLASKGWHPKEIQEWLRHADFYTTMNNLHAFESGEPSRTVWTADGHTEKQDGIGVRTAVKRKSFCRKSGKAKNKKRPES